MINCLGKIPGKPYGGGIPSPPPLYGRGLKGKGLSLRGKPPVWPHPRTNTASERWKWGSDLSGDQEYERDLL